MRIFTVVLLVACVCESIYVENFTAWEIHQYFNSLSVPVPDAASPGELPFLAVIVDERVILCNGVILAEDTVLTSAHCLQPEVYLSKQENVSKISVMAGMYDSSVMTTTVDWNQAKALYTESNSSSALVVLLLRKNFQLNWQIRPVKISEQTFVGEQECYIGGYEFLNLMKPVHQYKKNFKVFDSEICSNNFPNIKLQGTSDFICAQVNYSDINCSIDDAKMLFCNKTVAGFIEEIFDNCSSGSTLTSFIDIGKHTDFFKQFRCSKMDKTRYLNYSKLSTNKSRMFRVCYYLLVANIFLLCFKNI